MLTKRREIMTKCNLLGRHAVALCLFLVLWENADALSPSIVGADTAKDSSDDFYSQRTSTVQSTATALSRSANRHTKDQNMFAEPIFRQLVAIENEEDRHFDSSGRGPEGNLRARTTKDRGDRQIQEFPSPVGLGSPTPAPTLGVICYVCGDDTMKVTAGLSTTLDGTEYGCTLVEQTGMLQYFSELSCELIQNLAASDCGCVPVEGSITPAPSPIASVPSSGLDAPTPAPTFGVLCYVCGDENMEVTAGLSTTLLDGSEYDCRDVELAGLLELYSETACNYAQLEAVSDCGCVPKEGSVSSAPSAATEDPLGSPSPSPAVAPTDRSQPMASPVATPEPQPREVGGGTDSDSSSSGGGGLGYLAALLVIPVGAVIVYFLVKRKKNDAGPNNNKPSTNFAAPVANVDETSSNPPSASDSPQDQAHTPNSHRDETMPSVTASSFTSGGDGSASGTIQSHSADHLHPSIGETSAGSSSNRTPTPYASAAPSPVPNTVGYMPTNKDQCRTVVGGAEILAVAVAVDDDMSVQSEAVSERRRPPVDP